MAALPLSFAISRYFIWKAFLGLEVLAVATSDSVWARQQAPFLATQSLRALEQQASLHEWNAPDDDYDNEDRFDMPGMDSFRSNANDDLLGSYFGRIGRRRRHKSAARHQKLKNGSKCSNKTRKNESLNVNDSTGSNKSSNANESKGSNESKKSVNNGSNESMNNGSNKSLKNGSNESFNNQSNGSSKKRKQLWRTRKRPIWCGDHYARNCESCTNGRESQHAIWCNGDCEWDGDASSCVFRSTLFWCGAHGATSCSACVWHGEIFRGSTWCNGECYWSKGECYAKYPNAPPIPGRLRPDNTSTTTSTTEALSTLPPLYNKTHTLKPTPAPTPSSTTTPLIGFTTTPIVADTRNDTLLSASGLLNLTKITTVELDVPTYASIKLKDAYEYEEKTSKLETSAYAVYNFLISYAIGFLFYACFKGYRRRSLAQYAARGLTVVYGAKAGDLKLEVGEKATNFAIGDEIRIADAHDGEPNETNTIVGFGSVILLTPLQNSYPYGCSITLLNRRDSQAARISARSEQAPSGSQPVSPDASAAPAGMAGDDEAQAQARDEAAWNLTRATTLVR